MKYLLPFLFTLSLLAGDPITNQPSVGGKYVIVATNGYGGTLHLSTNMEVLGTGRVVGAFTNDVLTAYTLITTTAAKELGSVAPNQVGSVLMSGGPGVSPSFSDVTITGGTGTNLNAGTLTATNSVTVGTDGSIGVITMSSTNADHVVTLTVDSDGHLTGQIDSGTVYTLVPPTGGGDAVWTNNGSIIYPLNNVPVVSSNSFRAGDNSGTRAYLSPLAVELDTTTATITLETGGNYFPADTVVLGLSLDGGSTWQAKLEPYLLTLGTNQITATNDMLLLNGVAVGGGSVWTNELGSIHPIGSWGSMTVQDPVITQLGHVFTPQYYYLADGAGSPFARIDPFNATGNNIPFMFMGDGTNIFNLVYVVGNGTTNLFTEDIAGTATFWGGDSVVPGTIVLGNSVGLFQPNVLPGATPAYLFDTTGDWDNDAEFAIRNHGTNILTLKGSAGLDVQGTNPYMAGFNPNNNDAFELDPFNLTISPLGVATTRLTPTQTPGATPAYLFDTTTDWDTDVLSALRNHGTNVLQVTGHGSIASGPHFSTVYGLTPTEVLASARFSDLGDPTASQILIENSESGSLNYSARGVIQTSASDNTATPDYMSLDFPGYAYTLSHAANLAFTLRASETTNAVMKFGMAYDGLGFILNPLETPGTNAAYRLDTITDWDTDSEVVIANHGTNTWTIDGHGTVVQNGNLTVLGGHVTSEYSSDILVASVSDVTGSTLNVKGSASDNNILLTSLPGTPVDGGIQTKVGGQIKYFLLPNVADASGAIAYKFDTVNVLTNVDANLAVFAHAGTNKVWFTPTGEVHAKDFVMEASSLRTADTAGHSATIQAHDDDDNVRRTFATLQNGNTPSLTIAPPSGGTVTLQGLLKAADGTSGITTNITAGLVTFTIKNGLIVGVSL